ADGALFQFLHHGQRSVVGRDVRELLADADVVIIDSLEQLAETDDGHVVVAITPYGLTSPYADRPASELTIQAEAGAVATRGHPSRPPIQSGGRVTEWVSGVFAAVAVVAACRRQQATGQGELIDVSMVEIANGTATNFS